MENIYFAINYESDFFISIALLYVAYILLLIGVWIVGLYFNEWVRKNGRPK
jgi:hypothetical protein